MRSVERLLLFLLSRLLGLLCLLRFLRHVTLRPSQKLARCKSTSTCIDAEYTTFAKFIVRASKKVNDRAHRAEGGGSINILRRALAPPLTFALQRLAHLLEFLQRCLLDSRKLQAQRFQLADDRRTDHHTRKPFVIGRNDVPWRRRRRGVPHDVLIHRHISRP